LYTTTLVMNMSMTMLFLSEKNNNIGKKNDIDV